MGDLLFKDESFKIIGACMEVHKELGSGFLEGVYQDALKIEFFLQGIPNENEKSIGVYYKDSLLDRGYRADFVCYGNIIVELKAQVCLTSKDVAQVINYLKGTNLELGLLINFGEESLKFERVVRQKNYRKEISTNYANFRELKS